MKTPRSTASADAAPARKPPGGSTGTGQWWKVGVLLASLGATVLGWMAFTSDEPPVANVVLAPGAPRVARQIPAPRANGIDEPRPLAPSTQTSPAMPLNPVFQTPVTRTRRS
jgi:hypothetical protein